VTQIFRRALDSLDVEPIRGTEDARGPFFSPDGEWLGFFADGKLKKVSLTRGSVMTLADAPGEGGRGGAWGEDGTIVFAGGEGVLHRVPAEGGPASPATSPLESESHRWPEMLPGGKAFLFTALGASLEEARVMLQSLETGERRTLIEAATGPRYSPTGHVVFARAEGAGSTDAASLWALPFDATRRQATGPPRLLLEGVGVNTGGASHFDVAPDGALVYFAGGAGGRSKLVAMDRKGVARPLLDVAKDYRALRFSPDGRRLALDASEGARQDIWILDLARGTLSRLTLEEGRAFSPVWSPDGVWVAFSRIRTGEAAILRKRADGSGVEQKLATSANDQYPYAWSPDGRFLVFGEDRNVLLLPLQGASPGQALPLLATAFLERDARVSADGRWLAYTSTESGRSEVYVTSFPEPASRFQISTDGGTDPAWGAGGRELFYLQGEGRLMAVDLALEPRFQAARPRPLFEIPHPEVRSATYDAAPDGRSFVTLEGTAAGSSFTRLHVVLHWPEELQRAANASPGPGRSR